MDQRTIKLLIVAFILVGVIAVVVSFNIIANQKYLLSTTTSIPSTTTKPITWTENNFIETIISISSSSGNCLVKTNNQELMNSLYRVTNHQNSTEIDIVGQDSTKVLCWTLNGNCYCFSTSANKSYKWNEADQYCKGENMTLLSLESEEEDELIYHHIKSTLELSSKLYWTSGQHSLRWEWASGGSFNYTNWKNETTESIKENHNLTYMYLETSCNYEIGYWLKTNNSNENFAVPGAMNFICESNN